MAYRYPPTLVSPFNPHTLPLGYSYFLIRQVTGRIRSPYITADRFRSHSKIAAADVEPPAVGTSPLDMFLFFFQLLHQFIGSVGPDFGKGALPDIAEAEMPPELIGIDLAIPTDTTDAPAGTVALVHLQKFKDVLGTMGIFFEEPQI
jgi:hypothetical protein